jgi:hypothetical protein
MASSMLHDPKYISRQVHKKPPAPRKLYLAETAAVRELDAGGLPAERGDGLLVKVGEGGEVVLQVAQALCSDRGQQHTSCTSDVLVPAQAVKQLQP